MASTHTLRRSSARRGARPLDDDHDSGQSLVELLIAIVLFSTLVVGVLATTRTTIIASRTSKDAALVESALLSAAERVERASRDDGYTCEELTGPVEAAAQLKLGVDAASAPDYAKVKFEHLTAAGWVDGACPGGAYQANLVQRITITMINPDTGLSRSLEVIKGDV